MGTSEMVGSMRLTLFCNRCVQLFHMFQKSGDLSEELQKTCNQAISAFKSLKWPDVEPVETSQKVALFNTNEEIKSFVKVLTSGSDDADKMLNDLISKLEAMLKDIPIAEKIQTAEKLQGFFDGLGDYSFYSSRESLRASETALQI
jgi:hypothetical protein